MQTTSTTCVLACIHACRLSSDMNCVTGAAYKPVIDLVSSGRLISWAARACFPYFEDATDECLIVDSCASQLPAGEQRASQLCNAAASLHKVRWHAQKRTCTQSC
jgi:hypothetical protein